VRWRGKQEPNKVLWEPAGDTNCQQYQYCDKVKTETAREVSSSWETCVNWHGHYVLMLLKLLPRENLWLEEVTKTAVAEIWTGQVGSKLPALKYKMHQSI
jgi:hypothetical protein